MKIGIFGGTFDPIHQGHLFIAKAALEQFQLEKVIFIPAYVSPHKVRNAHQATSANDRYEMVRLAIANTKNFEVFDGEIKRQGVSYTVDTLGELTKKFPQDEFYLILGEDSFRYFNTWKQSEEICKMAHLLVAPRENNLRKENMENMNWIEMTPVPVSSSDLRKTIESGEKKNLNYLSAAVLNYIVKHRLYQGCDG